MIDVKDIVVDKLADATGLKVYYELYVDSKTQKPCITYLENRNSDNKTSEVFGYSDIGFAIKVWGKKVDDIVTYQALIDTEMRKLGFDRTSSNELTMNDQICKIMQYDALGYEHY